jgi:hypothetical protein
VRIASCECRLLLLLLLLLLIFNQRLMARCDRHQGKPCPCDTSGVTATRENLARVTPQV